MFKTLFPNKLTDKIRLDFECQLNIDPQDFGERSEPLQKEVFTSGFLLLNIPQPAQDNIYPPRKVRGALLFRCDIGSHPIYNTFFIDDPDWCTCLSQGGDDQDVHFVG